MSSERTGYLLEHPELFLVHYFGDRLKRLQDFHLELIRIGCFERRGLAEFPATHGKTTIISTLLPIWAVCRDPNTRIGIVQKNTTDAEKVGRALLAELSENTELIRDFGPFRPQGDDNKPWSLSRISVARRTLRAKEPTIALFGARAKDVLGHRTKWTICDDVVTPENSATPEQREKTREWFDLAVKTGPEEEEDRITVVGTPFHPDDLYAGLRDLRDPETGEPIYVSRQFDAIVDDQAHLTLWPERWPWRRLMEEKASMGTLEFNKRYRCKAVDPSQQAFKEEYVKGGYSSERRQSYPGCLDENYLVGDYDETWRRVSGFDPAVGAGRSAKFCAHLTLAEGSCTEHERCFWVVDLRRDQMTLPHQVSTVINQHEEYELQTSYVETNSFQKGLYQAIQQKLDERGLAFSIQGHNTNRVNKHDPETGIPNMSAWFENGKVHIPWGNQESRRKMQQFVDELIEYPGRTTDTVMAFWFAWLGLQQTRPKFRAHNRLAARGSSWAGVGGRTIPNPYYVREEPAVADRA